MPDEVPVYINQFVESGLEVVTPEERAAVEGLAGGALAQADALFNLFMGITTAEQLVSGNLGKAYQQWVSAVAAAAAVGCGPALSSGCDCGWAGAGLQGAACL